MSIALQDCKVFTSVTDGTVLISLTQASSHFNFSLCTRSSAQVSKMCLYNLVCLAVNPIAAVVVHCAVSDHISCGSSRRIPSVTF